MSVRLIMLVVSICTVLSSPSASAADETYDLRGPAPKKNMVFRDTLKFTMKNADVSIDLGTGAKLEGKMDKTSITEKEEEILGVDGRNITKLRTKLLKDETIHKSTIGGETQNETEKNALVGEIIFSELTKKGWKHVLEDTSPSDKQKKELKDFDDPESDDELYPAEKVKIGQDWKIDASAFRKIIGSKMTDAKGTGKGKLLRVEKYDGELCAVIELDLDIQAKIKQEDSEFQIAMKGKVTTFRSLAEGVDLKYSIDGTAKFDGNVEEDGMKFKMMFAGKMLGEGTSKIKKK